jgi:hypothetical protein
MNPYVSIFIAYKGSKVSSSCLIPQTGYPAQQLGVAITFWTCIREVLGSNLGRDTGYFD